MADTARPVTTAAIMMPIALAAPVASIAASTAHPAVVVSTTLAATALARFVEGPAVRSRSLLPAGRFAAGALLRGAIRRGRRAEQQRLLGRVCKGPLLRQGGNSRNAVPRRDV